jgi:Tfp pilus assembly protein PilN
MYARLNLATKPLISHRRFLLGAALLGLIGSALFVFLGWHFYTLRKADAEFRARLAKNEQQIDRLLEKRADLERFYAKEENRNLQERAKFIGDVIEARSVNWTKMFMDLERTLPSGVHVLRIEPTLDHGSVSVKFSVAGSSEEAEAQLLKAFEDSKAFSHIELTSEGGPKQGPPGGTDVFTAEFSAIYTGI